MAGLDTTNTATMTDVDQFNTLDNTTSASVYTNGRDIAYVSPTGDDTTGDGSINNPLKTIATGIAVVNSGVFFMLVRVFIVNMI